MEIVSLKTNILDTLLDDLDDLANEAEKISGTEDYALQTWLDNQDVCSILNVTKRTLQTYRDTGRLPYTQIDRKIYYKPADVENLLKNIKAKNG